jgi:MFS family permease
MIGNIPAAILVERHGRKPYMTYSLAVIALGVGGIGLASSFEALYVCRLLTGLGVAALSTAGTLMITDISTPLNRASTYAPIMSAFSAGTAVGPALGGMMVDQMGLQSTFCMVGLSYFGVALVNRSLLKETKSTPMEFPWQRKKRELYEQEQKLIARANNTKSNQQLPTKSQDGVRKERDVETFSDAIQSAFGQWIPLLHNPMIRSVMILNGIYWITIAGGQMTLLPLILTNDLHYTATQVGQVYMGMSMIQIFGNPIFGKLIDTIGKVPVMIGATTCIGTAMYTLPYACSLVDPTAAALTTATTTAATSSMAALWPLATTLGLWSIGSSMLSTAPLAYVSDRVDDNKRAQAIALLRTSGDIGFLIGATGTGALADYTNSIDLTMQSNGSLLLCATVWFALRQVLAVTTTSTATATTTASSVTDVASSHSAPPKSK